MLKQEFLNRLQKSLSGLPRADIEERLTFYSEMIDNRMEEGLSEEDAVAAIGNAEEIASQIVAETSLVKIAKERIKPKRQLTVWEIVLLALGSPIWLSLLIAAFAVVLSVYASLWAVVVSLWAVFAALVGCSLGCVAGGILFICSGDVLSGIATVAGGLVCAGLSIFAFYGCLAATKGTAILAKITVLWIKRCFTGKEVA